MRIVFLPANVFHVIGFLVTKNAMLCLKWLSAFLFWRLSSSDNFVLLPQKKKNSFAHVWSSK